MSIDEWTPEPRMVVIVLPHDLQLVSMNDRLHHSVLSARMRAIRKASANAARDVVETPISRAIVNVIYHASDKRQRDTSNLALSGKAAVDGLVDAGVITGDHDGIITRTSYFRGDDVRESCLVIQVIEIG